MKRCLEEVCGEKEKRKVDTKHIRNKHLSGTVRCVNDDKQDTATIWTRVPRSLK